MATRLTHRLERLERATNAGERSCPSCGRRPSDEWRKWTGPIVVDPGDGSVLPRDAPELCAECGARLIIKVELDRAG